MSFNKLCEQGVKTAGKGVLMMQGENCGFKGTRMSLMTVSSEEQQTQKQKAE